MIARFAGGIVQQILEGVGTDRALASMDVLLDGRRVTPIIATISATIAASNPGTGPSTPGNTL